MTKNFTRFAPSPTGDLHLGSLRTALINFVISKFSCILCQVIYFADMFVLSYSV